MRTCIECGTKKPVEDFYKTPGGHPRRVCKVCRIEYQRLHDEKRKSESEDDYSLRKWSYAIKHRFSMTVEQYFELEASQDYKCAICRTDSPGKNRTRWCIDHDRSCCSTYQSCGECVRGLLCGRCNTGLGSFNDDTDKLLIAIRYLQRQ